MNSAIPILAPPSGFEPYDRWFRAKVQASLDGPSPSIPHDEVMTEMRELIESKRRDRHAS